MSRFDRLFVKEFVKGKLSSDVIDSLFYTFLSKDESFNSKFYWFNSSLFETFKFLPLSFLSSDIWSNNSLDYFLLFHADLLFIIVLSSKFLNQGGFTSFQFSNPRRYCLSISIPTFHGPCLPNQLHSRTQSHLNIAEFGSGKHETRRVPASQFERGWPVKRPVTRPFRCKTLPRKYFRLSKVAAIPFLKIRFRRFLNFNFVSRIFFSFKEGRRRKFDNGGWNWKWFLFAEDWRKKERKWI